MVKQLSKTFFDGEGDRESWIVQKYSAPTYKAKTTEQWFQSNIPGFTAVDEWPEVTW